MATGPDPTSPPDVADVVAETYAHARTLMDLITARETTLRGYQERIIGDMMRRHDNAQTIAAIPPDFLHTGMRARLWSLALAGEDVRAERPLLANGRAWHLVLWEHRARLVPPGAPTAPGDFSGDLDHYRPTVADVPAVPAWRH